MYKFIIFISLLLGLNQVIAQQVVNDSLPTNPINYTYILNNFTKTTPPSSQVDSVFIESFSYLDELLNSVLYRDVFERVRQLVASNKPTIEILKLYQFRHKVDSLNKLRYKTLLDYRELEQLKKVSHEIDSLNIARLKLIEEYMARALLTDSINSNFFVKTDSTNTTFFDTTNTVKSDTTSVTPIDSTGNTEPIDSVVIISVDSSRFSLPDSLIFEELEKITYHDTINFDSVLQILNPYNDTLLLAIDKAILSFHNNSMVQWIKDVRNDTIDLHLVSLDGDSLLVKLYDNCPSLIHFGLTDYWGTKTPAVIRDIEKRSFRILIDDAPEVKYETEEKVKKALSRINKNISSPDTLSIKHIPFVITAPTWVFGGDGSLDVSQVGMYQWAQGGNPLVSFLGGLELFGNYKKGKKDWDNKMLLRYGVIRQGRMKNDPDAYIRSNEDRLELSTKYGYNIFSNYFITLEADSKTQIASTYEWDGNTKGELKTDFMSPAFIAFSLGLDYKPSKKLTLFLAPVTLKSTIVLDPSSSIKNRYSVDTTKDARHEFGARFKGSYSVAFRGDIEMKNTLELFSNYIINPQNIDINWDFSFILPVNDFIKASIGVNIIYDDDTKVPKYYIDDNGESVEYDSKGIQIREMLTLGFYMRF